MPDLRSKLRIVHYPHPALRTQCEEITDITDDVRAVAARMFELVAEHDGLGLAAPQVAVPWRMFITTQQTPEPEESDLAARVYINPVLSASGDDIETREEGCLSLPDVHVDIRRPVEITITATDLDGEEFTLRSDQLIARVWQHEIDHLDGILIIDKMNTMDRLANRKALKQLTAGADGE